MMAKLTEDWLRSTGFKWTQEDRQPHKHWMLWIGNAISEASDRVVSADELGVEVSKGDDAGTWWYFWLRSDLAGRYSRFIHVRHLASVEQLTAFIEVVTGRQWEPANVLYGQYWSPDAAERLRKDAERLDWRIAEMQEKRKETA